VKETDKLLDTRPFDFSDENKKQFVKSFKEISLHHYKSNKYFKFVWDKAGMHPENIYIEEDIKRAPFILVNQFKFHDFKSSSSIVLTLGSSGTSGQRSVMHLDQYSLDNFKKLCFAIHKDLGMTNSKKYNYLCFTYDPDVAKDLGTAFTDKVLTSFTGINQIYYTFKYDESLKDFIMDEKEIVKTLKKFESSGIPTRILGFPAFLFEIVQKYDLQLDLGLDSWVQTGGGWKSKADQEIPKDEFRNLMSKKLGIPKGNIRDLFGMVEHGIPYVDCADGALRIPNYARVYIRDPESLEILPDGEKGLIQFVCTYNTSYPSMNILTTDWGRLVDDGSKFGTKLEIFGRAGMTKNKGCALKALELMK
jgi:phenylacetate-coenzyme A ligase PaaK-like adenylate-forming protein